MEVMTNDEEMSTQNDLERVERKLDALIDLVAIVVEHKAGARFFDSRYQIEKEVREIKRRAR